MWLPFSVKLFMENFPIVYCHTFHFSGPLSMSLFTKMAVIVSTFLLGIASAIILKCTNLFDKFFYLKIYCGLNSTTNCHIKNNEMIPRDFRMSKVCKKVNFISLNDVSK